MTGLSGELLLSLRSGVVLELLAAGLILPLYVRIERCELPWGSWHVGEARPRVSSLGIEVENPLLHPRRNTGVDSMR